MIKLPEFVNPVLSERETRKVFAPHSRKLCECIDKAWAEWEACPQRHALDARTRASFISSIFRHNAKASFFKDPNVSFTEKGNSFFLYFGEDAKVRLKKLRANGTYSNIMTGRQLSLMKQMSIPGILPGTYLTVGYQLDDSQQRIQHKKITLQSYKGVIYTVDLDDASSASSSGIIPVLPQIPPPSGPRARARKEAIAQKKRLSSGQE